MYYIIKIIVKGEYEMSKNYLLIKPTKVIMLEDEERVLKMTKNYFSSDDINFIITKTIYDAKSEFKKNNIDCIIIDASTCSDQTLQFIHYLKTNQKLQHIPFVILTSKGFVKDRIKGYKLGCSAYLSKPFDPMELKFILKNIVSQKDLLKQELISDYFVTKRLRLIILKKYKKSFVENIYLELTPKEELILNYILQNKCTKRISEKLKIHIRTVEKSVSKILDKTHTKNTKELKLFPWNIIS